MYITVAIGVYLSTSVISRVLNNPFNLEEKNFKLLGSKDKEFKIDCTNVVDTIDKTFRYNKY